AIDERGFEAIRRLRRATDVGPRPPLAAFKAMVREQFLMLLIDEEAAITAIPKLLPKDADTRKDAFLLLRKVLSSGGDIVGDSAVRLRRVARLFGLGTDTEMPSAAA